MPSKDFSLSKPTVMKTKKNKTLADFSKFLFYKDKLLLASTLLNS